jgi:putative resolvase
MKAKEVLELLQITRPTLSKYVREGKIKVNVLHNGRYDYDKISVNKLFNKNSQRKNYIHIRVGNNDKQKIQEQEKMLENFCFARGITVDGIIVETGNGLTTEDNVKFLDLMEEIMDGKVARLIVYSLDRLNRSREGLESMKMICERTNTEILVLNREAETKDVNLRNEKTTEIENFIATKFFHYGLEYAVESIKDSFNKEISHCKENGHEEFINFYEQLKDKFVKNIYEKVFNEDTDGIQNIVEHKFELDDWRILDELYLSLYGEMGE